MIQLFQYQSNIQEIPKIRKDLEFLKKEWSITDSVIKQILLIIEELFSNIIRYAFPDENEHQVEIALTRNEDEIQIEITDDGVPFNPMEYSPEPSDDPVLSEMGGMGLSLIKAFASHITYSRDSGKNHLLLTKKVKIK